jgi:hypothetical protein
MAETFEANVVLPDDPGFVYDKQVEFVAISGDNEWDD